MAENENDERRVRDAVQIVIDELINFEDQTRTRILRTVSTFYDLGNVGFASPEPVARTNIDSSSASREHHFGGGGEISPKDFLFQKQPKTDVDRVACLAYYLAHYRETKFFKTADITKLNTEAAQHKFSNSTYAVTNATNAGLLVSAGKGKKQISAMGERYIEALPDATAAREVKSRLGKKRSSSKRSTSKSKK
jgi:restriction endonuclease Mrr